MGRIDYGKPGLEVDTAKCHGEQEEHSSTSPNTTLSSTIERLKGKLQQQGTRVAEVKSGPLTEATARAQTVLELLLSAGLAPHQPISILQRVSGQSVDDNSCSKTTVQLLLEQVHQLRQLKSRLSLQHQQVLSLSPPLRRPAGGPPDPIPPGSATTLPDRFSGAPTQKQPKLKFSRESLANAAASYPSDISAQCEEAGVRLRIHLIVPPIKIWLCKAVQWQ